MSASPVNAFADLPAATVKSLTGDTIEVRPYIDQATGRAVVQLSAAGFSVLLDNASVPGFNDIVTTAALCGEIVNVASGNPTPAERAE